MGEPTAARVYKETFTIDPGGRDYQTFLVKHDLDTAHVICSEGNFDIIDRNNLEVHVSKIAPPAPMPNGAVMDMMFFRDSVTVVVVG